MGKDYNIKPPAGFSPPDITGDEIDEVVDTLCSGWLTTGPKTRCFEEQFANFVGCGQALGLSSATAGLFLGLKALGIGPGDEVITTPFTFAATANVVIHLGAKPVFADIREDDFNIDPEKVESAVTEKTRAIIPVHYAGRPCDLQRLEQIARRHRLAIIEDAAHAFGTEYQGRRIGAWGHLAVYSLHAVKNITTGEGGMAVADDADLINRMRILSLHGMDRDAWKRFAPDGKWQYDIVEPGYKFNMMDLQAAIGLQQLRRAPEMLAKRRLLAERYRQGLGDLDLLRLPDDPADGVHSWHLYSVLLDTDRLRIDRDRFIAELSQKGVTANVHYHPVHLFSCYRRLGYGPGLCPVAEGIWRRQVTLPLYSRMTPDYQHLVIEAVRDMIARYRR